MLDQKKKKGMHANPYPKTISPATHLYIFKDVHKQMYIIAFNGKKSSLIIIIFCIGKGQPIHFTLIKHSLTC